MREMKVYELILNGERTAMTCGATDWADATEKLSATSDWFWFILNNRKDIRITFEEVK
jgi:hypothetical protein